MNITEKHEVARALWSDKVPAKRAAIAGADIGRRAVVGIPSKRVALVLERTVSEGGWSPVEVLQPHGEEGIEDFGKSVLLSAKGDCALIESAAGVWMFTRTPIRWSRGYFKASPSA